MNFGKEESKRVKGIAIILLCFHHLCYSEKYYDALDIRPLLPLELDINLGVLARVCVPIFVFISAYGLAVQYGSKTEAERSGTFILRRWLILMSAWWFAYPFQILLTYIQGKSFHNIFDGDLRYMLLDFMGLSDFFKTPMLVGINWYMFLAQMVVVLTPLIYHITKKYDYASLLFAFVAMQLFQTIFKSDQGGDYCNYLFVIVLGSYMATHRVFEKMKWKKNVLSAILLLAILFLLLYLKYYMSKVDFDFRKLQFVVFGLAALVICILVSGYITKGKILLTLGTYSGSMYFIHIFIVRSKLLHTYIHNIPTLLILSVVISFGIAFGIEKLKALIRYDRLFRMIGDKLVDRDKKSGESHE